MWHAARKQEKKVREVMVDYQKRAERRREHYEKLRIDPHQLLRIHGNRCKMHLNPKRSGDQDATMIPWQGDSDNMISRYDVRIHLDYIPDRKKQPPVELSREEKIEESRCNYERYRALVVNLFRGVSEETALKTIDVEEMYPTNKKQKREGKEKSRAKAAIGFSYSNEGVESQQSFLEPEDEKAFSSESEYEIDMDVDEFSTVQVDRLNVLALDYGISAGAFSKTLRVEKSELEEQKQARIIDKEKANLSGRKSRKERKQMKELQTFPRLPTPPSYARRDSPTYEPYQEEENRSQSSSRSSSSEPEGQVEFITEFGEPSDTEEPTNQISPKPARPSPDLKSGSASISGREDRKRRRSDSRDRYESSSSRSRHRGQRSPPHSYRRRSRSRDAHSRRYSHRSYSRSPRRSGHRGRRSRSRSRSRDRYTRRRSRSRSARRHRWSYSRSPHRHRRSHSRSPRRGRGYDYRDSRRKRSRSHSRRRRSRSHSRSPQRRRRSRTPSQSKSRSNRRSRSSSRSKSRTSRRSRSYSSSSSSSSYSSLPDETPKKRRVSLTSSDSRSRSGSRTPAPESLKSDGAKPNPSPEPEKKEEDVTTPAQVGVVKAKLTPQERLMKRMQTQLNKQFKSDKKNQQKREKLKEAEKMEREELLREQMRKIRDVRDRSEYTFSSKGEVYSDPPSRSPTPPSPVRHGITKNSKDPSDFYYGRFL